ncbi:MAG: hypothetical protein NUV65_02910 [Candidatus Roizmanbacteria bacterium]|nr:hypothetical protein [Candidatus Roizmanbacteria bacterium]
MRKFILHVLLVFSIFYVASLSVSPVFADDTCSINFITGISATRWMDNNNLLVDIASAGHSGEEANTIELKYGNNNWISVASKSLCNSDTNKSEIPYNNDVCIDKVAPGHFQYKIVADPQTATYTPVYTITLKNNCDASKTLDIPPPAPTPTTQPQAAPTPLPAGITQYVTSVCLEPYTIHEPVAGCPADHRIVNNWQEDGIQAQCYDWNYGNVTYSHTLQLRSKIALNKTFPVELFRRTTLRFEGDNDVNHTATYCAADSAGNPACILNQAAAGTRFVPDSYKVIDLQYPQVNASLANSADGFLALSHVRSFTGEWGIDDSHYFFAMQRINQATPQPTVTGGPTTGQTDDPALRLASFTPTPTPAPTQAASGDSTNCVSIYWDPMGKVADTQYLEPIEKASVTLKNKNALGNVAQFTLPNNALFKNPFTTGVDGSYSFFVPAGTYYLSAQKQNFTFPITAQSLLDAKQKLLSQDPAGEYIDTSKLYNDSSEPIVEKEGVTEVRNMLMEPPQGYQGTKPTVVSYNQLLDQDSRQIIYGVVSHPKAVVGAFVNNGLIAQTQAAPNGQFKLVLEGASIPQDAKNIQLRVEKVAIGQLPVPASTQFSKMYTIELLPSYVAGFAFSSDYSVAPGALVEVIVPELNDLVYVSTHADQNGFARIPNANMPPFPYTIRVRNPQTFATLSVQKPAEFVALSKAYYTNEQANPYDEKETMTTPSAQTLSQIQKESKKNKELVLQGKIDPLLKASIQPTMPTDVSTQSKSSSQSAGRLAALLIIVLLLPIGVGFIIMKSRNRTTEL